jgi:protease YdgD
MIRTLSMALCLYLSLSLVSTPGARAVEPAPLAAVGRLHIAGKASCTGALIAPDLVLTAGHCLMRKVGGTELVGTLIEFVPGRSPGLPVPEPVQGATAAVHPIYGFGIGPVAARLGFDFGLLRLIAPVPPEVARPLGMGALPAVGDRLFIAGYRGGAGGIARQRRCEVVEANHAFAALGCEVDGGESGSPMLRVSGAGPEIVGVLANKGRIAGQPVGFGPVTETAFDTVAQHLGNLEALEAGQAVRSLDEGH